jgi:hypothetical protein
MRSTNFRLCIVGLIAAASLAAQPAPSTSPAETARGNETQTRRPRAISPELSAALAAGVKFEAPPAEKKQAEAVESEEEETDLREVDRPRNSIIRLPKYIVEGERPPVFRERDIHTEKGLADLAIKRYLSTVHTNLNRYHLPSMLGGISSEELALQMYREQERLRNMQEFDERVYLYRATGDDRSATQLKKDSDATFMRRSEFSEAPRANGR